MIKFSPSTARVTRRTAYAVRHDLLGPKPFGRFQMAKHRVFRHPPAESQMADLLDSTEEWLAAQAGLDDEGRTVASEFIGTAGIVAGANAEKGLAKMFPRPSKPATRQSVRSARRPELGPDFRLDA